MPSNSNEYQRNYREKTKAKRKVVSVSLTIPEHLELSRYAKAQGLSLSSLLREASLAQCRSMAMRSKASTDELKELKRLIANIANNLNQIAHHSNRVRHVVDENAVFEHLAGLDDLIKNFVDK